MKEEKNLNEYIPLQEASRYSHYSQEYLSLRARQGKLQALKFGRNWVTKKEWLEEYLKKVKEYNNQKNNKGKYLIPEIKQPMPVLRLGFLAALVFVLFFSSLIFILPNYTKNNLGTSIKNLKNYNFGTAETEKTTEGLVTNYFSWFREEFTGLGRKIVQGYSDTNKLIENGLKKSALSASRRILGAGKKIIRGYVTANNFIEEKLATAIGGYTPWVSFKVSSFPKNIVQGYNDVNNSIERKIGQSYKLITNLFTPTTSQSSPTQKVAVSTPTPEILTPTPEKVVEGTATPQPTKEGLVVIPSTAKDEETTKKIKESFSDEVKVNPKDETSGIIIPVFRDGEGEKYLYILVPIKN